MNPPLAIVIGCHVNGYGAIRSLALKGFRIIAMHYDERAAFAQASRFVEVGVQVPDPRTAEKDFIDFLVRHAHRWKNAMIVETNDDIALALSRNKPALQPHYRLLTADWDVLRKLIEKSETYAAARECGVPYPGTFTPQSLDDVDELRDQIPFPCILKPVVGHAFAHQFRCKNFRINDQSELQETFNLCHQAGHEMIIQEIIPGPDSNIYQCALYMDASGVARAMFVVRKLRQNPPKFGVARVAISHAPIKQITEASESILRHIGFSGIAHVEFKLDERDNTFKLIEINGRVSRSNWLATYCGVNLPWIAWQDLQCAPADPTPEYEHDVYWIDAIEDIRNSFQHRNEENLSLADYEEPYLAERKTFADLSLTDPMPLIKRITNAITLP